MTTEKRRDYCPRCGVAYEPLQEYCLECGARLPTNRGVVGVLASSWQRRFAWYPGDWIWPVSFFFVLTIVAHRRRPDRERGPLERAAAVARRRRQ